MRAPRRQINTIDEYIAGCPDEVKSRLQALRQVIHEEAPEAEETIKYGMPTYTLHGNFLFFSAFKKHIGFYPRASAIEAFQDRLSGFRIAKGTIQFPHDQPLPLALIRDIVKFRAEETRQGT
jgi:uncharacterized protein YdhG (YjbR/CyaY superfamily)